MEEKIKVPDINALSIIFLDIIKNISKSGNVLNNATLSQFLSKNAKIRHMMQLAYKAEKEQERPVSVAKDTLVQMEEQERIDREKKKIKEIMTLENKLDTEMDAHKRAVLTLVSLTKVESNEKFFDLIDEFKEMVIDEAKIEERERVLSAIKNLLLREEQALQNKTGQSVDQSEKETQRDKKSMLGRIIGFSSDVKLKMLQKIVLKGLRDLKETLGETYYSDFERIEERIKQSDSIEYLFSNRKYIIGTIKDYVSKVNEERENLTGFMLNIGDRLQEMEEDINVAFSNTNQNIADDQKFNDNLNAQIKGIGTSVEESTSFEELKSFIVSEMTRIAETLEEKSRDYKKRLEASTREREQMRDRFKVMIGNVIAQNKVLVEQNKMDPLTHIYNRATFDDIMNVELNRYQRYKESFSVIMFDIDHFKNINDTYGHVAGDKVLRSLAGHISDMLRETDVFARYGGEEFIVLLPNTDARHSLCVAEKLREVIEEAEFLYEGNPVPITASIGVTEVLGSDNDIITVVKRVDAALYQAKANGRNAVYCDFQQ